MRAATPDAPVSRTVVPAASSVAAAPAATQASDSPARAALESVLRAPITIGKLPQRLPDFARISALPLPARDTEPLAPVDVGTLVEVARGAKRMSSDYEKGQLLAQVAKRYVRSDSLRDAYLDAVFSMSSDYERSKAMIALLDRDSIPASHTAKVLRSAQLMSSDMSRSVVLRKISPSTFADTTVQRAYLGVISVMSSNTERANAITSLIKWGPLPSGVQLGVLKAIALMTSSTEKANVLLSFQEQQGTADPDVRRQFLKTAETLTSDSEYRRVMMSLMK